MYRCAHRSTCTLGARPLLQAHLRGRPRLTAAWAGHLPPWRPPSQPSLLHARMAAHRPRRRPRAPRARCSTSRSAPPQRTRPARPQRAWPQLPYPQPPRPRAAACKHCRLPPTQAAARPCRAPTAWELAGVHPNSPQPLTLAAAGPPQRRRAQRDCRALGACRMCSSPASGLLALLLAPLTPAALLNGNSPARASTALAAAACRCPRSSSVLEWRCWHAVAPLLPQRPLWPWRRHACRPLTDLASAVANPFAPT